MNNAGQVPKTSRRRRIVYFVLDVVCPVIYKRRKGRNSTGHMIGVNTPVM